MNGRLPPPPVPVDADLSDFRFMPLEVARLRRSRAWLICKRRPELAFYMLNLWTAAWHERPAGSLEDDDDVLADAAMCSPEKWPEVRADTLRGWVKCSDGRLYHPVVAEKVLDSWHSKDVARWSRECERIRKENVKRVENQQPKLDMPPKPVREVPEFRDRSAGKTPENALNITKGKLREGREKGREKITDTSTDGGAGAPDPVVVSVRDRIMAAWNAAADIVNEEIGHTEWARITGMTPNREKLIAVLLKVHTIDAVDVALDHAMSNPWARGETERTNGHTNWRFNFDYFMRMDAFTRLLEQPRGPVARRPQVPTTGRMAALHNVLQRLRAKEQANG